MKPLLNKPQHKHAKMAAKQFAKMLCGDFGYTDAKLNRIALESMVAGWIMAQGQFGAWMDERLKKYPMTPIIDEVQDEASELASGFL